MRIVGREVLERNSAHSSVQVIKVLLCSAAHQSWNDDACCPAYLELLSAAFPSEIESFTAGVDIATVFVQVALALQNLAGSMVSFGKTLQIKERQFFEVVYQYTDAEVGIRAGDLAVQLICSLLPTDVRPPDAIPLGWNWERERSAFIKRSLCHIVGLSAAALIEAAESQGIAWFRVDGRYLIQFGFGKYHQRLLSTVTGRTSSLSVELARDKRATHRLLRRSGLPVPKQVSVFSAAQAEQAADRIGYPVVVKPCKASHGRGVSIGISRPQEMERGFSVAARHSRDVIVEKQLPGDTFRLLVVGYHMIAALRQTPAHVCGDGVRTIRELVAVENSNPSRGVDNELPLTQLVLGSEAIELLACAGFSPESVLQKDQVARLSRCGNLSRGATAADVTDQVHPDNRQVAERAVAAIGLDIAGVDFICPDISGSWREAGGGICEVNSAPGLHGHLAPSAGTPRDVSGPIIELLYPPGSFSSPPIVFLCQCEGAGSVALHVKPDKMPELKRETFTA